jgi:hypothetical protein
VQRNPEGKTFLLSAPLLKDAPSLLKSDISSFLLLLLLFLFFYLIIYFRELDEKKLYLLELMREFVEDMDEEWMSEGMEAAGDLEESSDRRVGDRASLLYMSMLKKRGKVGGKGTVRGLIE